MVDQKTWKEFRDIGLLWWINMILHTFGWAIVYVFDEGEIIDVYPARVKFRGFDAESNDKGYVKITDYLKENIDELHQDLDA